MNRKDFIKKMSKIPQKYEDFGTITYQMKLDIFAKFINKDLNCVEFGCYKGYTTDLFSTIFKNVLALDKNDECLEYAKNNNRNNKNTSFEKVDLYDDSAVENIVKKYKNKYEVAFIDAWHSYEACKSDILNAMKMGCKYIVLDDVGVYDGLKQAANEISDEYSSDIKEIYPIGIDWKHYKLPILNLPIYCLRFSETNLGYSSNEFTWILRDKTDIDINNGSSHRPMFHPMNVNLQVGRNYCEFVSGHIINDVRTRDPERVVPVNNSHIPFLQKIFFNLDMSLTTNNEYKPPHKFVPFPAHRFKSKELESFFLEDSLFEENDTNYEGLIIELK
tara:strand:- start:645 stop:1640 length:996 start_codon:yes stop_codon:yes gene_type:complete